jgi:cell wall-associated NlpC family hydrolase
MKRFVLTFLLILCVGSVSAQVKALDRLEVLYEQGHYGMVYRSANRLLDRPDYDYSFQPEFYKALAIFRMADRDFWMQMHPGVLQEARNLYLEVKNNPEGVKVFNAHLNHVAALKQFLVQRVERLKKENRMDEYDELQQILFGLFDHIPDLDNPAGDYTPKEPETNEGALVESAVKIKKRDQIVDAAKQQIGVQYKWAGTDPNGFDCSGFTSYVFKSVNKELPRRAEDQYNASVKIKQWNAHKGDLIFFNNGSGISHVGIVISNKGEPLTMIHASSSKGIVITNVEESEYWLKRIYGFGTFVE